MLYVVFGCFIIYNLLRFHRVPGKEHVQSLLVCTEVQVCDTENYMVTCRTYVIKSNTAVSQEEHTCYHRRSGAAPLPFLAPAGGFTFRLQLAAMSVLVLTVNTDRLLSL